MGTSLLLGDSPGRLSTPEPETGKIKQYQAKWQKEEEIDECDQERRSKSKMLNLLQLSLVEVFEFDLKQHFILHSTTLASGDNKCLAEITRNNGQNSINTMQEGYNTLDWTPKCLPLNLEFLCSL